MLVNVEIVERLIAKVVASSNRNQWKTTELLQELVSASHQGFYKDHLILLNGIIDKNETLSLLKDGTN
uniref:Replicative DNA helicase n=1 Tax=Syphacia muris TaxID=451379 RepID=A0A0N5ASX2_9BILA